MSKYKLVLSSIKNQLHIYSIYIVSLVFSFTFYLTFINLSVATLDLAHDNEFNTKVYALAVYLVGVVIVLLIMLLINYVQTLLINARSKELAIYRLISFSSKELRSYLLVEQLIINIFSLVIALILSFGLSTVLITNFNQLVQNILSMELHVAFSINVLIAEVISIVGISVIITYFANRKIEKKELIDLLNTKHAVPDDSSSNSSTLNALIVFATWIAIIYVLIAQFGRLRTSSIIIVFVVYIISIFTIYNVIAKIVVKVIPKKVYYSGSNSFTTSIIKRKLGSNAVSMAFVTILILVSVYTIGIGIMNTKFLMYLAQYDDIQINTGYQQINFNYQNEPYNFSYNRKSDDKIELEVPSAPDINVQAVSEYSYNKFATENNLQSLALTPNQAVVIATDETLIPDNILVTYNGQKENLAVIAKQIISGVNLEDSSQMLAVVDDSYGADWTKTVDELYTELIKNGLKPKMLYEYNGTMSVYDGGKQIQSSIDIISEENANDYLTKMDIDTRFELSDGQLGYIGTTNYSANDDIKVVIDSKTFKLSQVISDKSLNTLGFGYYVINDESFENLQGWFNQIITVNYTQEYDQDYWSSIEQNDNFYGWVSNSKDENTEQLLLSVIVSGALIFISMILLLLLITMIGVQVNVDSIETKEQFKNLSRIGYSKQNIHTIINKITFIYFIIPLIIGILNIVMLYTVCTRYLSTATTTSFLYSTGAISVSELAYIGLFMLLIYVLYCILVNISYKRVIDKNFD